MLLVTKILRCSGNLNFLLLNTHVEQFCHPRSQLISTNLASRNFNLRNCVFASCLRNSRTLNTSCWFNSHGTPGNVSESFTRNVDSKAVSLHFDLEEFNSTFKHIYEDLTQEKYGPLATVAQRLGLILKYNVVGGKKARGQAVVLSYKKLSKNIDSDNLKLAYVLGWCVELLQSFFIVSDDIMDDSITRRGQPCWFRCPEVGLEAVNDSLLLECSIYQLLEKYFKHHSCYNKIVNEFLKVTRSTVWGQCLDMAASPAGFKPKLEMFTPDYYWTIVEYKTALYTFCLPVHLAMHIIGSFKKEHYELSKAICINFGKMFQMQDDFLDVYGDPQLTGKIGSDIRDGKCSWLAMTALQCSSKEGKKIIADNYGVNDLEAVNKVLKYYDSLQIKDKFYEMEASLYNETASYIHRLDDGVLNKDLFFDLLEFINKRQK